MQANIINTVKKYNYDIKQRCGADFFVFKKSIEYASFFLIQNMFGFNS